MVNFKLLSCWLISLSMPLLAFGTPVVRDSVPNYPADDPFYEPPKGFEIMAPGSILRYRQLSSPIAAFSTYQINITAAYQILFRTTNTFGEAVATVTTILIPSGADLTKLLSYQVPQDAANPNCSPSYALLLKQATDKILGPIISFPQLNAIKFALQKGWPVAIPDHLGRNSAFLANHFSGQVTLDNLRAALGSTKFTNISSNATITIWGYSGGSLSSGFAVELRKAYAPELKIAGAALGGTVPDLLETIYTTNKGFFAGLIPPGIQGLANEYPIAANLVASILLPSKAELFNKTKGLCLLGNIITYANQDISSFFSDPNFFTKSPASVLLDANNMGQRVPDTPLYIYKSITDEVSPVNNTDELVSKFYCPGGARVQYVRTKGTTHVTLASLGTPQALMWLEDRMNGKPVDDGCSQSTVVIKQTGQDALRGWRYNMGL
ncbi:hypothetical protein TMatcc_004344 [Talaromyces marneffei ATCC 18224]|uniref:Secretory lipase, putative n=2 Tax=Talaromyces marneffei TaxID=37727 RepID=B6Q527_TALMQ|nr:uncharacterized protein EYB26_000701 [Talaromyces marneffei]EEA27370.1 secretory lipase, putative [Talaromyces marneffei ATCC 18224]KAE8556927.1 hypothetical protein EYB25_001633 [Talaromyces marneffei]QGA13056.1 hypothetical protein EYB26_000701 [Talaromyces marneffei]